ncbi:HD family hydrolase [Mesorhizobium sp. YC-39]|uniref:HD family hydrolase n=1 Tax=unclassified Mesorhizobium TaxID=325217 RepID=UPI0021E89641|nr:MULTISPECIES: HD family hydrolase [unclassified Mesorhizobium]MCV3210363.1 HD family hydrolase [Mesorhizobium sp. YC-2]MCV3230893.1 HD family hydrolase [Mesorhizobium sp. YC-39]
MAADRAGAPPRAWQRMLSGRRLDLLDPSPLDIEISDIAHGLARVARWNGQTSGDHAFSVAQHSLLVEALFCELAPDAPADARLAALLHDAPEYVIGDMISPFKSVMGGSYKDCELRLQRAIHLRFSLPAELGAGLRKEIKRADQIAAYYEATLLAGFSTTEATEYFGRPRGFNAERFDFTPRSVTWAQNAFLKRYAAIETKRQAAVTVHSVK